MKLDDLLWVFHNPYQTHFFIQLELLTLRRVNSVHLVVTIKSTYPVNRFPERKITTLLIISLSSGHTQKLHIHCATFGKVGMRFCLLIKKVIKKRKVRLYTDHCGVSIHQPEVLRTAFVIVYHITITHMQQCVNQNIELSRYLKRLQSLSGQVFRVRWLKINTGE